MRLQTMALLACVVLATTAVPAASSAVTLTKTCLTGTDPSVAVDAAQITAVRGLVELGCPCSAFDGTVGKTHRNYTMCAGSIIAAQAPANLRPQCVRTVKSFYARSICGVNPALHVQPCIRKSVKTGAVTCGIRPTTKADGITPNDHFVSTTKATFAGCPTYTHCIDAGDTDGNLRIAAPGDNGSCTPPPAPTVFVVVMENRNWSAIHGSTSAPYLNGVLLAAGAHAEQYFNPPALHPSEPNYLWLEAGTNFGVLNDGLPATNSQGTTAHLVTLLNTAGKGWKSYQEDIGGTNCPLTNVGLYAPKHNPMVFFQDVTGNNNLSDPYCIAHVRPYTELATDLAAGTVAPYNFITPNLCDDGHDTCGPVNDAILQTDNWLSTEIPRIVQSNAYQHGGVLIITWDEGLFSDGPIGLIVLSRHAKAGYSNSIHYTHSSTLRSLQDILGVSPYLGDAVNATDLSDLFLTYP
ncbi:MAG: hypothetical protein HY270_21210 [Deltaproteobacteria bacterium]|nr:hypothetical protein [Deltaproteobacteria bacterium]